MQTEKTDPFRWLGQAIPDTGDRADPRALIRAVNGFHTMGKDKALATMDEYVRRHSQEPGNGERDSLYLVLTCLFDVPNPPGYMPEIPFGAPTPPTPSDRTLVPRFPLVIFEDIPLNLVRDYLSVRAVVSPLRHIAYFREHGRLRSRPLAPSPRPLEVMSRLEASPQWLWERSYRSDQTVSSFVKDEMVTLKPVTQEWGRAMVREQLLRLVTSIYPIKADQDGHLLLQNDAAGEIWRKAIREVGRMRLRWDTDKNDYVRE